MRSSFWWVPLIVLFLAVLVMAMGTHKTGVVKITVNCDTLNDTASGSGLAEYTDIVWGMDFKDFRNILAKVILEPSNTTVHGYGSSDSAIIWLQYDNMGQWITADSSIGASLPCTLSVDSELVNWGSRIAVKVYMNDTTSDTVMTAEHKIKYDVTVRE